jgi:Protein of unknown function (DUF3224)
MMKIAPPKWVVLAGVSFCLTIAHAQSTTPSSKEASMTQHASGPFDVKVTAQEGQLGEPLLNRMTLDKQYHGDLQATGKGQMLTAGTEVKGSGAYVAIERVTGTLKGLAGSFVLQHSGTMTQNAPQLTISLVPDSGTEQLKGITGKMNIIIAPDGKHSYDLEYTIPKTD